MTNEDDTHADGVKVLGVRAVVSDAHRQRLEALGHLVAALVHELNGPLCALSLNLESLERDLRGDRHETVRAAKGSVDLMRGLIADFLGYAQPHRELLEPVDVRDAIERAVRISAACVRHRATVSVAGGDVPRVIGSRIGLVQVLVNLLMNAADAMGQRADGRISVSTHHDESRVIITVTDDGCGIPEDALSRIFDEFFTTKADTGGTGLGLPTSRRIVEAAGGEISARSTVGAGTRFVVVLRRAWPANMTTAVRAR